MIRFGRVECNGKGLEERVAESPVSESAGIRVWCGNVVVLFPWIATEVVGVFQICVLWMCKLRGHMVLSLFSCFGRDGRRDCNLRVPY